MSSVEVPHFNLPFKLGRDGATVVEQDSIEDVANCVVAIFLTHVGWRDEVPSFGVQDFAMRRQPIGEDDINNLISAQEPRAGIVVNERRDSSDRMIDHINVGVSIVSKGGV